MRETRCGSTQKGEAGENCSPVSPHMTRPVRSSIPRFLAFLLSVICQGSTSSIKAARHLVLSWPIAPRETPQGKSISAPRLQTDAEHLVEVDEISAQWEMDLHPNMLSRSD